MASRQHWSGPRSEFPWEQEALEFIRKTLAGVPAYTARQCFTFTAKTGHLREIDLFVATPSGLYLIEIKSQPGRLTNQGGSWTFRGERTRTIDNPLPLTNQKSKELRDQLQWAARQLRITMKVPFIEPVVFLSDPALKSELDDVQRHKVYGRDGHVTGLPGIVADLLSRPPRSDRDRVPQRLLDKLPDLLHEMGVQRVRKHRKIGPWQLAPNALDTGPTWQDYLAENTALPGQHRRVRIYLSEQGATAEDRELSRRVARREYLVLQGIEHPGIQRALDFSDEHDAGPAILFPHQPDWLRLDHYLAEYGTALTIETRLNMIRQLAEAVDHAHRRHLYHRALAARSVWVQFHTGGRYPKLRIADWQAAHLTPTGSRRATLSSHGEGSLAGHIEAAAQAYLAPEFGRPDADSVPLDVFGLGALAYLVLTGTAPAETRPELIRILTERQSLVPSAVADSVDPWIDALVQDATRVEVCDRLPNAQAVLRSLDGIDERLAADEEEDPLEAVRGTVLDGWTVERKLGSGSTARALLVKRGGDLAVFKVALNEQAAGRLAREAVVLRKLRDSRIVRLREEPREIGNRTVMVLDRAGERTLADHLRTNGRLSLEELERYGEDLFNAVEYLEGEDVWHRDIKPDNLAIRDLSNGQRRLVLFDFSLADVDPKQVSAGTPGYLDPFLDPNGKRPRYDLAAERYAVAVTLHEMASTEQPAWGDGVTEPRLLDPAETTPQLAEDRFEPQLREQLVAFFATALHRDATKRHAGLNEMRAAWRSIFSSLADDRPLTTPATANDEAPDAHAARDQAAEAATRDTALVAAGLTTKALSVARDELGVDTVDELIKIPGRRIQRLRGVGVSPRNELLRRARDWRRKFKLADSATAAARAERDARTQEQLPEPPAAGHSLDEVVDRLVPRDSSAENRALLRTLALPDPDGEPSGVPPWAPQRLVAEAVKLSQPYVATLLGRARERWAREPLLTAVRLELVELLAESGRVMEVAELAVEVLARRGSALDAADARLALAGAAVRAAIETEEKLDNPRLVKRRSGDKVLVALVAEDDPALPSDAQLLDHAQALGAKADELVRRDPLPVTRAVVRELRGVRAPDGMPILPDTRLVSLSAAASAAAGVTARFELYPVDLEPVRAVRLAQIGGLLTRPITPEDLRARVLAQLPALREFPDHAGGLADVLRDAGYRPLRIENGRYSLRVSEQATSTGTSTSRRSSTGLAGLPGATDVLGRLASVRRNGGFLVVKADLRRAAAVPDALSGRPELALSTLDVVAAFVAALRAVRERWGAPDWTTVLSSDTPDAPPDARLGFSELASEAFAMLEQDVRARDGVVLLHDAAPLARYPGGMATLERLADAARDADATPHGLWLVTPMADPREPARLDRTVVPVTPGGGEEIALSRHCIDALGTDTDRTGRAS